jgi:tetratricopeptide (TPR) repeat protein
MTICYPEPLLPSYRQKITFLLTLLLFPAFFARTQFVFDANCRDAYKAVLSLRFDDAKKLLDREKTIFPSNRITAYLENYIDFLTLFIGEDQEQFRQLNRNEYTRLKFLEQAADTSPYYRFCQAQVRLQWAFVRLKFGEYITAVSDIRRASILLSANQELYPAFLLNYSGLAIVHTIAGIVPDQYKWLSNLLGFEGSVAQGTTEFRALAGYTGTDEVIRLVRPEILFYLAFIEVNLNRDKSQSLQILKLSEESSGTNDYLKNPLMVFSMASILMKNGYNDKAVEILSSHPNTPDRYPIYYLDYMTGLAKLNRLDPDADTCFLSFLRSFHGLTYIKSAYQKLAWSYFLKGDIHKYYENMDMIPDHGTTLVDEDRQALSEARRKELPNLTLLKARFLFDGGYYDRAIHELLDKSLRETITTKKDLLEYTYRMGRIYHETGNIPKAFQYYNQTIRLGSGQPWYFAANAALQMGIINENSGNYREAAKDYQLCLSMHYEEYKNSLSQKAKAGLKRVQQHNP